LVACRFLLDADAERGQLAAESEEQLQDAKQGVEEEHKAQEVPCSFIAQYDLTYAPEGEKEVCLGHGFPQWRHHMWLNMLTCSHSCIARRSISAKYCGYTAGSHKARLVHNWSWSSGSWVRSHCMELLSIPCFPPCRGIWWTWQSTQTVLRSVGAGQTLLCPVTCCIHKLQPP
jgi:hypothetical protein